MRLAFCGAVWAGIDDVNVHTVVLGLKTAPQGVSGGGYCRKPTL